jgi:sigma-B regulation protein RsbU (phosphoserine phosphatase)
MGDTKRRASPKVEDPQPIDPKKARAFLDEVKRSDSSGAIKPVTERTASDILKAVQTPAQMQSRMEEEQREQFEMLQHDLDTAAQIQSKLLPESVPQIPGYDFAVHYAAASKVSGDFYDFIQFDRNTLGILVADASGKGLAGSLLMVEARAVIRAMASVSSSPKEILTLANRVLVHDLQRGMFITIFYALLDIGKGTLKVASAGHLPLLQWRRKDQKCFAVNPTGLVLGAANEEMFTKTLKEATLELVPGDRFVLYTDGVTELMNAKEEEFGRSRLVDCTLKCGARNSTEYVNALVGGLRRHQAGAAQSDDITIVTGRLLPEEEMWETKRREQL